MMSQSSGSDANSISRSWSPVCSCGRATTITKAWTNENPGRRFVRCGVHGFINWADAEKPFVSGSNDHLKKYEEENNKLEEEKKKLVEEKKKLEEEKKKGNSVFH
ncbi:unnamed protein product [Arabidopsis thaliana]|uniref:DUF7900 domain-containing protein n=1 Tax=Arabidopsis thaliana TaxID=3702 RepID=A0A5S9VL93_ARATH|nr:unnamed protein product [Arabidopsis thaliana]